MTNTARPSGGPPFVSERDVSRKLGIARSVLWRARQVASIPEAEFEALVEAEQPLTVTQLVEHARGGSRTCGRRKRCPHSGGAL